jgi:zinc/manganese transport system substrate-binding protein
MKHSAHAIAVIAATGAIAVIAALTLVGCSAPAEDDGRIRVVASTNVYGDLAARLGGDLVDVTSIIDNPAQDPHSFEASARVQLAVSKADIVIVNGGGYDDWAGTLLEGAGNPDAVLLTATELTGRDGTTADGTPNEHVWYDFGAVREVAAAIADALSQGDPASASVFAANLEALDAGLAGLEERESQLATIAAGMGVAITEPVPLYLLEASGFVNVTPPAFTEAIEAGTDVSPAVLAETLALFADGTAGLLVYNSQTSGPQSDQVIAAAEKAGVPVVAVTETLPAGMDYVTWMSANLDAIEAALE